MTKDLTCTIEALWGPWYSSVKSSSRIMLFSYTTTIRAKVLQTTKSFTTCSIWPPSKSLRCVCLLVFVDTFIKWWMQPFWDLTPCRQPTKGNYGVELNSPSFLSNCSFPHITTSFIWILCGTLTPAAWPRTILSSSVSAASSLPFAWITNMTNTK